MCFRKVHSSTTCLNSRSIRSSSQAWVTGRYGLYVLFRLVDRSVGGSLGTLSPQVEKDSAMLNIYVGNLSYETSENDLRTMFEEHGTVDRASVVMDRMSNRSKGFGFVEMPNDSEARAAIGALNESETQGRKMTVNEAKPKGERPARRERY